MDDNVDQKNNFGAARPPEPPTHVSSVDGFVTGSRPEFNTPPTSNQYANRFDTQPSTMPVEPPRVNEPQPPQPTKPEPPHSAPKAKEPKGGLSIWLVVLLIVLFAGAAAAGVYFWQSAQAKKDLDAEKAKTSQAVQAQINNLTKTSDALKAQTAALQKTVDSQQAFIASMTKTATALKTACGKSCDAIVVPTPTPTPTPAPTSTATPTPTPTPAKTTN